MGDTDTGKGLQRLANMAMLSGFGSGNERNELGNRSFWTMYRQQ